MIDVHLLKPYPITAEVFMKFGVIFVEFVPLVKRIIAHDLGRFRLKRVHSCVIVVQFQVIFTFLRVIDVKQKVVNFTVITFVGDVVVVPVFMVMRNN